MRDCGFVLVSGSSNSCWLRAAFHVALMRSSIPVNASASHRWQNRRSMFDKSYIRRWLSGELVHGALLLRFMRLHRRRCNRHFRTPGRASSARASSGTCYRGGQAAWRASRRSPLTGRALRKPKTPLGRPRRRSAIAGGCIYKGRVFDAFGHHRRGNLLKFARTHAPQRRKTLSGTASHKSVAFT